MLETLEQIRKARSEIVLLSFVLVGCFVLGQGLQLRAAEINRATTERVFQAVDSTRVELRQARNELAEARRDRSAAMHDLHELLREGRTRSLANRRDLEAFVQAMRAELRATRTVVDSARVALPKRKGR